MRSGSSARCPKADNVRGGDAPERESVLEPGDLIVAVRLPGEARGFATHARYLKVRERTSYAFAVVSAAAALRIEAGTIREARLALGGVAAKPWRARPAEKLLEGRVPDAAAFRRNRLEVAARYRHRRNAGTRKATRRHSRNSK